MNKLFHLTGGFNLNQDTIISKLNDILTNKSEYNYVPNNFSFDDSANETQTLKTITNLLEFPIVTQSLEGNKSEIPMPFSNARPNDTPLQSQPLMDSEEYQKFLDNRSKLEEEKAKFEADKNASSQQKSNNLIEQGKELEESKQKNIALEEKIKGFEQQMTILQTQTDKLKENYESNLSSAKAEYESKIDLEKSKFEQKVLEETTKFNEKEKVYNGEVAKLTESLALLGSENEGEKTELLKQMQESKKNIENLQKEKEEALLDAKSSFEDQIKEVNDQFQKSKEDLQASEVKRKKLADSFQELQLSKSALETNLSDTEAKFKELETSKGELETAKGELETNIIAKEAQLQEIQSAKNELETNLTNKEREITDLTTLKADLENNLEQERNELIQKEEKINSLISSNQISAEEASRSLAEIEEEKQQIILEKQEVSTHLENIQSNLEEQQSANKEQLSQIDELKQSLSSAKTEEESKQARIKILEDKLKIIQDENTEFQSEIETKRAEEAALKVQEAAEIEQSEQEISEIVNSFKTSNNITSTTSMDKLLTMQLNNKNDTIHQLLENEIEKIKHFKTSVENKYDQVIGESSPEAINNIIIELDKITDIDSSFEEKKKSLLEKLTERMEDLQNTTRLELIEETFNKLDETQLVDKYDELNRDKLEQLLKEIPGDIKDVDKIADKIREIEVHIKLVNENLSEVNLILEKIKTQKLINPPNTPQIEDLIKEIRTNKHLEHLSSNHNQPKELEEYLSTIYETICNEKKTQNKKWVQLIKNILKMWNPDMIANGKCIDKSANYIGPPDFISSLNNREDHIKLVNESKRYTNGIGINQIIQQYCDELQKLEGLIEESGKLCLNDNSFDESWQKLLALNAEDIGGAVRTYIRYRDVPSDKITESLISYKAKNALDNEAETCIFVNNNLSGTGCDILKYGKKGLDSLEPNENPGNITNSSYGPFTQVFNNTSNNKDVYNGLESVLNQIRVSNYNVTLFGYGFSGSGKSYTLLQSNADNDDKKMGVTQQYFKNNNEFIKEIKCQVFEISPYHNQSRMIYYLKIDAPSNFEFEEVDYENWYRNNEGQFTINPDDIPEVIESITAMRIKSLRIATTPNNPESSRGHIFLQFNITFKESSTTIPPKFVICDMAGSENTAEIKESFFKEGLDERDEILKKSSFNLEFNLQDSKFTELNLGKLTFDTSYDTDKNYDKLRFISRKIEFKDNINSYLEFYLPDSYNAHRIYSKFKTLDINVYKQQFGGGKGKESARSTRSAKDNTFLSPSVFTLFDESLTDYKNLRESARLFTKKYSGSLEKGKFNSISNTKGLDVLEPIWSSNKENNNTIDKKNLINVTINDVIKDRGIGPCAGIENYYRTLWIFMSLVKRDGFKKYGYVFDITKNNGELYYEKDDTGKKNCNDFFEGNWGNYDIKQSYYNALDIWLVFYMKFIFNIEINKDFFINKRQKDQVHISDNDNKRSELILDSINTCINNINSHLSDTGSNKINENNNTNDILLKLKIASELKPKLCIPLYLNINDENKSSIYSHKNSGGDKISYGKDDIKKWFSNDDIKSYSNNIKVIIFTNNYSKIFLGKTYGYSKDKDSFTTANDQLGGQLSNMIKYLSGSQTASFEEMEQQLDKIINFIRDKPTFEAKIADNTFETYFQPQNYDYNNVTETTQKKNFYKIFKVIYDIKKGLEKYKGTIQSKPRNETKTIIKAILDSDLATNLKFSINKPIPGLWHEPLTLSSIDFFMAINGIVSPFDIKPNTEYWLPPTDFSDPKQLEETVKVMNHSISIFDNMMCKVEKENEVLNIWKKLRDTYIVNSEYAWDSQNMKSLLVQPTNEITSPLITSPASAFATHWLEGGKKNPETEKYFKEQLNLEFNYYTYPKLKDDKGNDIHGSEKIHSLEYLYSTIMDFILNYITIIVNQGDGIVATLDHLSVFFKNPNLKVAGQTGSNDLVEENVDINYEDRSPDAGLHFMMYNTLFDLKSDKAISKYVMLTLIKRGEKDASGKNVNQSKFCLAAHNTLEFAQRVSAKANACKCDLETIPDKYKPLVDSRNMKCVGQKGGANYVILKNNDSLIKFLNNVARAIFETNKSNTILFLDSNIGLPFNNLFSLDSNIQYEELPENISYNSDQIIQPMNDDINILDYGLKVSKIISDRLQTHTSMNEPYISLHYKNNFEKTVICIKRTCQKYKINNLYLMTRDYNVFYSLKMMLPTINIIRKNIPTRIISPKDKFKELSEILIDLYMILQSDFFIPADNSNTSTFIQNMIISNRNIYDFDIKTKIINC